MSEDADAADDFDAEVVAELARRAKAALRKRARGLRNALPMAAIEARSAAIVDRLEALPVVAGARKVALFWPMTGKREVDLSSLDPRLRSRGVRVAYPAIDARTRGMTFRDPVDPSTMIEAAPGLREPGPSCAEIDALDVVIVPALLVDGRGYRLGYGGGYYDRTLPRVCPPASSIAVAFEFQLAAELPIADHDVPVDLIVTEERVIEPQR